ncbi:helitron_like_N domain-containing protein [Trichonephila inaurata madagascariensis]|uniref:Helitron_like_N domain-containing protein n=1 Tax=Trichonephila inaurata madagascariensis TaxID=2747483 RepID=A0A8X7BMH9_9ARAC|nr:helitron_like_N domain-containing protein [Trichonephila inaurata madagascariensis]
MMWVQEQQVLREEGHETSENVILYISDERLDSDQHRGRYNAPKTNEVAIVFKNSDGIPPNNRDIYIYPKQRQLCRISTLKPNCDPMNLRFVFSMWRDIFNPILYGGKLMQQYVVDFYVKVEGNSLNFIRHNQRTLRVEPYLGLADHVNALATEAGMRAGVTFILPSSFIGSSRAMQQRTFRMSSELPDKTEDPKLHEIVKSTMIHGPCGVLNPNAPCIVDGVCTRGYPEQFRDTTAENIDGYPMYRRRDKANHIAINGNVVDNRWIMPYNPCLSKKYNAHDNMYHDCAKVFFENNGQGLITWDEIRTFLNAKYISAPEEMWRLLEKKIHEKSHAIIPLPMHLPNM